MQHLQFFKKENIQPLIKIREGETKLGEKIADDWQSPKVKFVLLGIEEDIGVRLNKGVGGTDTAWQSFLAAFLNIQSTQFLEGSEIGILGHFNFDDLKDDLRSETVETIDIEVGSAINLIVQTEKLPIIIGGGHNNAYPIIQGCALALQRKINVINLDAHSDFRRQEGRHSGNAFRYAYETGFLNKYAMIGLHQNYNAQPIIQELSKNRDVWFCFWEDIFLKEKLTFADAIYRAIDFTSSASTGVELDLDCIENILSSAMTPCGFSTTQARQYLYHASKNVQAAYIHICEGASILSNGQQNPTIGKLISYLVSDSMKGLIENEVFK